MRRYVLTGAPCGGKTTVLNELRNLGFYGVQEVVRVAHRNRIPFKDIPELNAHNFNHIPPGIEVALFDRGLPDSVAARRFRGVPISTELDKLCRTCRYDGIFLFELLPEPLYEEEGRRRILPPELPWLPYQTAHQMNGLIRVAYENYDYGPVDVPFLTVDQRVDFVLKQMGESVRDRLATDGS